MGVKDNLEKLMKERGLNASSLADRASMPKSTVYALLKRDSSNISYQTAQKLADALECSESDILDFGDSEKAYHDGLKRKILNLTQDLNNLKSCDEYIEVPLIDDTGEEFTIKENLNQPEINYIEMELAGLYYEIEQLLDHLKISKKPTMYSEIINYYIELNDTGKLEAVKRVEELTYIEKYTQKD